MPQKPVLGKLCFPWDTGQGLKSLLPCAGASLGADLLGSELPGQTSPASGEENKYLKM